MRHVVTTFMLLAACNGNSSEPPVLQNLGAEELLKVHVRNVHWSCWRDRRTQELLHDLGSGIPARVEFDIVNKTAGPIDYVALLVTVREGHLTRRRVPMSEHLIPPLRVGQKVHVTSSKAFEESIRPWGAPAIRDPDIVRVDVELEEAARYKQAED